MYQRNQKVRKTKHCHLTTDQKVEKTYLFCNLITQAVVIVTTKTIEL